MGIKGRVKQVGVFLIEVEMPQGTKQSQWEKIIRDNLCYPTSTGSRDFPVDAKVKLVEKKVRYE